MREQLGVSRLPGDPGKDTRIETYEPPSTLPGPVLAQVTALVQGHYFHYPYLDHLASADRYHFLALDPNDQVVGYASYKIYGRYAYCANLLVSPSMRGRGLGRALDEVRFQSLRALGKRAYVSCLCEDTASQRLKWRLRLRPVCVKFGHQRNFVQDGAVGTAVLFSDGELDVTMPDRASLSTDRDQARIRSIDPGEGSLQGVRPGDELFYQEVLTGPERAVSLIKDPAWAFVGVDLDLPTNRWHFLFQYVNQRYRDGLARAPALWIPFDTMLAGLPRPGTRPADEVLP